MTPRLRLVALTVVVAHVWVAALPCPPPADALGGERVAMTRDEARALLALARGGEEPRAAGGPADHAHHVGHGVPADVSHAGHAAASPATPPCHAPKPTSAAPPVVPDDALLFLVPACPCGCDQRAPLAGASTARVGAGVPPASPFGEPVPPRLVVVEDRMPRAPDAHRALPEPVPRPAAIA